MGKEESFKHFFFFNFKETNLEKISSGLSVPSDSLRDNKIDRSRQLDISEIWIDLTYFIQQNSLFTIWRVLGRREGIAVKLGKVCKFDSVAPYITTNAHLTTVPGPKRKKHRQLQISTDPF